jgi:hypothetical protein
MRLSSAVIALVVAGCSLIGLEHNDPPPVVPSGEPEGILVVDLEAAAEGPSVSVEESVGEHLGGDAVAVHGALFIDDTYGTAWLCQETMQPPAARQPSCSRPALLLEHPDAGGLQVSEAIAELLEAGQLGELHEVDAVRWVEDATYYGSVIDPLAGAS